MNTDSSPHDEIGYWSEIKLDIIREYAAAYSRILTAQTKPQFHHVYIDAFAGSGVHKSKTSGEFVPGSPTNALWVMPPFREYHFIDLDSVKVDILEQIVRDREDVHVSHGDCNKILFEDVFPHVRWEDYRRALCVLDPYGLHLDWKVIEKAGRMRSVEIFLNFPVADINRNVLWRDPEKVSSEQIRRMNIFWGDESWKEIAYVPSAQRNLFDPDSKEKARNEAVAEAFRIRLQKAAGFADVPPPIAMRNSRNAVVYYLYFAAQKPVAADIARQIFNKYRDRKGC
jgi:three-Cys-motif partner protein